MSAQVKKRFEEMQAYLGRDAEGLKKLKLLKDDVNELRTSLAATKVQLEQTVAIKDAARERADAAEAELVRVRLEHDRVNQTIQGLARRATAAEKAIATMQVDGDAEGSDIDKWLTAEDVKEAEIKATVKAMRRRLKHCPAPTERGTYEREALAAGWSHSDIWLLGASVATVVALMSRVTITTDHVLHDIPEPGKDWSDAPAAVRQSLEWLTKNLVDKDSPPSASDKLRAAATPAQKVTSRLFRGFS